MAIISSSFDRTILSGEDSRVFLEQIDTSLVNKKLFESLSRGKEILEDIKKNGCYRFNIKIREN